MTAHTPEAAEWKPPHIKLYYVPICPWSQRVRITAEEVGLPLELVEVPMSATGQMADWFTKINPRRMVPTVEIQFPEDPDTVHTVTESMIICRLLVSIGRPGAHSLLPGDAKIQYEVNWFCDEADRTINDLYHFCMKDDAEVKQGAMASLDRLEGLLSQNTGPFVLGNHFSLADIAFAPFFVRMCFVQMNFNQQNLLAGRTHLKAFKKGCLLRPSFFKCTPRHDAIAEVYKKFIPRPFRPPPLKLYCNPMCPFSQRVHITLKLLNVDFNIVHVDIPNIPDWYKKINPHGMLPTLELATGERLFDSVIILKYLGTQYTSPIPLLRSFGKESPLNKARMEYLLDEVEKKIKVFLLFKATYGHIPHEDMVPEKMDEAMTKEMDSLQGHLEDLNDVLLKQHPVGPFFLGDELSYADVAAVPFFAHFLGMMHTAGRLKPDFCVRMQTLHAAVRTLDGVDEIIRCMVEKAHAHHKTSQGPTCAPNFVKFTPRHPEEKDENGNTWANGKFKNKGKSAEANQEGK